MSAEAIHHLIDNIPVEEFWIVVANYSQPGFAGFLGLLWILFLWKRTRTTWILPAQVTSSLAVAVPISRGLRTYLVHPRPFGRSEFEPLMEHTGGTGMPSNHAVATAVFAVVFLRFGPRYSGLIMVGLAALVGTSRVFVGIHFPRDILAGWALGGGIALIISLWPDLGFRYLKRWSPVPLGDQSSGSE